MISAAQLLEVMPQAGSRAAVFAPLLSDSAARFGIDTHKRIAGWISQIATETRELNALVESFNYRDPARLLVIFRRHFKDLDDAKSVHARGQAAIANRVYSNRMGNGDEASGDGWKYRGRSCIQTTGKSNYIAVMMGLDIDAVEKPELLEVPKHAADAAGLFWRDNNLNGHADRGDIIAISKGVNGGTNGLQERIEYYHRAVKAFCK